MITVNLERPHICIDGEKYYVAPQLIRLMSELLIKDNVMVENIGLEKVLVHRLRQLLKLHEGYEIISETPKDHSRRSGSRSRQGYTLKVTNGTNR